MALLTFGLRPPVRRTLDPTMTDAEPWVSVDDIARHLGVAKDTIYRWIETRRLPSHRIGRFWKFKVSEVDGWVRAGGAANPPNEERHD